jgi:tripartite-type tricarboxylate transporter receptor subunit TctC
LFGEKEMTLINRRHLVAVTAVMLSLWGSSASAQASYPTQTVKIIVPFTPGTGMDTIARVVAPRLSERLGQPVVVQNQPGASGNIGADTVAKSTADGYTILMGANTMLMASQMYKNVSFDPVKDFAPVSMAAYGSLMLVAHPKTGIKSLADLIKEAKAKPGSISFGSPGVGTPHHMAMELFKLESNTFMLHVPYRGSAGYTQDLLGGELNVGFLPVHIAQGMVKSGRLNALAVGSPKRHPVAPDVPTFDEVGVKRIDVDLWYAFFVPSKTPAPVITRQSRHGRLGVHACRANRHRGQRLPTLGHGDSHQTDIRRLIEIPRVGDKDEQCDE